MPDGFGPDNLPYGVVRGHGAVVRLHDELIPLAPLARAGALGVPADTFDEPRLNRLLELGPPAWTAVREALRALVAAEDGAAERVPVAEAEPLLPFRVGDFVDGYASLEHASNVGRLFRPDTPEPLLPNWRHLPVAYHGRAGTVVVSGTPVRRPCGILGPGEFGPEPRLDFELELGFVCGAGSGAEALFGVVLVNDWSARAIQRFEYQPLGPYLGKSFATSISPWVVPLDALRGARVPGPPQVPAPLPHLRTAEPRGLDVRLEAELNGTVISRTNARGLYWTAAQQLAHAESNGARIVPGDLFASGTISGDEPGSQGCLLELSWDGRDPLTLADGSMRTFLQDGDTVVLRGRTRGGIALGEVRGMVEPARAAPA